MNKRGVFPILLLTIFIPTIILGQSTNKSFHSTDDPNIFKNEEGATIEYLGMQNWTAEEIQDSLKSLAPNRPVSACMAVLKQNLGFADSMVMGYYSQDTGSMYTVVTVLEEENSSNFIQLPEKEKPTIEKWIGSQDLGDRRNQNLLSNGLQFFGKEDNRLVLDTAAIGKSSFFSDQDVQFLNEFYKHIKNQDSQEDKALALETIKEDGNILNRILASVVLLNFENTDDDIYLMLEQMRSENPQISRFSATVFSIMARNKSSIDWSGATESIQSLLAGTNLHNLRTTLQVLTRTKISSSLADQILSDNTFLLEERLKAKHEETKKETLAFVRQISGNEFESSTEATKWLAQF